MSKRKRGEYKKRDIRGHKGPKSTYWPSLTKVRRSNIKKISDDGWCTVAKIMCPCFARSLSRMLTLAAEWLSSPDVYSSKKMIPGLLIMTSAMDSRLRSPPAQGRYIYTCAKRENNVERKKIERRKRREREPTRDASHVSNCTDGAAHF